MHQRKVSRMVKSADGGAGLFAQDHQAYDMVRRSADFERGGRGCQADGKALAM